MNTKPTGGKRAAEHVVKDIRRATWRHPSSEDKIRIVPAAYFTAPAVMPLIR